MEREESGFRWLKAEVGDWMKARGGGGRNALPWNRATPDPLP